MKQVGTRKGVSGAGKEREEVSGAGREREGMSGAGKEQHGIQPSHFISFHKYLHLIVTVDGQRGRGWDGVVAEVKWFKWA